MMPFTPAQTVPTQLCLPLLCLALCNYRFLEHDGLVGGHLKLVLWAASVI